MTTVIARPIAAEGSPPPWSVSDYTRIDDNVAPSADGDAGPTFASSGCCSHDKNDKNEEQIWLVSSPPFAGTLSSITLFYRLVTINYQPEFGEHLQCRVYVNGTPTSYQNTSTNVLYSNAWGSNTFTGSWTVDEATPLKISLLSGPLGNGGTASVDVLYIQYDLSPLSSGVRGGGAATVQYTSNISTSGGARAGGTTEGTTYGTGGVRGGGTATNTLRASQGTSGGALAGSTNEPQYTANVSTSGGVRVSGTSSTTEFARGGARGGGTATVQSINNITGLGGASTGLVYSMLAHLDEGSGSTTEDVGGKTTGTLVNATWSTDVPPTVFSNSNSLQFNYIDQGYVVFDQISITSSYRSISVWVKPGSLPDNQAGVLVQDDFFIALVIPFAGEFYAALAFFGVIAADFVISVCPIPLASNEWSHLAFTYDGSVINIYVNGIVNSEPIVDSIAISPLGRYLGNFTDLSAPYDGLLDDPRVYDYVLTSKQVAFLAAGEDDRSASWASIYQPSVSGGSLVGGTAAVHVTYNLSTSKGALVGGSSTALDVSNPSVSGGVRGGGTASVSVKYSLGTSGGDLGGGIGTVNARYNLGASGGVLLGGSVSLVNSITLNGVVGVLAKGSASIQATYNLTTSGGSRGGGSATVAIESHVTGGIVSGGTATITTYWHDVASSGVVIGGTSSVQFISTNIQTDGGVVCGGDVFVPLPSSRTLREECRPNGNENTLWTVYDYTNIDERVLPPKHGDIAGGPVNIIYAQESDSLEEQIYTFESPTLTKTVLSIDVYINGYRFSTNDLQVRLRVDGVWQTAQPALMSNDPNLDWNYVTFPGPFDISPATQFAVGVQTPLMSKADSFFIDTIFIQYDNEYGAVLGSNAEISVVYNISSSGGAVLGGTANPAIAPSPVGGTLAGGTADIEFTANITAIGGARVGGSFEFATGVVCGGTAIVDSFQKPIEGGLVAGGSADVMVTYAVSAASGCVAGGIADVDQYPLDWTLREERRPYSNSVNAWTRNNYVDIQEPVLLPKPGNMTISTGFALADSDNTDAEQIWNIQRPTITKTVDRIHLKMLALKSTPGTNDLIANLEVNGVWQTPQPVYLSTNFSGKWISLTFTGPFDLTPDILPFRVSLLTGTFSSPVQYIRVDTIYIDYENTYGVVLGGTSDSVRIVYPSSTGGCLCGGTATVSLTQATYGGAVLGGSADILHRTDITSAGGVVVGGVVGEQGSTTHIATGGVVAGGLVVTGDYMKGSGGALAGGTSNVFVTHNTSASSGAVVGGTVSGPSTYNVTVSGGVVVGSSDVIEKIITESMAGGALVGGSSNPAISQVTSGGALIGGSAIDQHIINYTANGGAVCGGLAGNTGVFFAVSRGGVIVGYAHASMRLIRASSLVNRHISKPDPDPEPEVTDLSPYCDIDEACKYAHIPKVTRHRQGIYMPPKNGRGRREVTPS